MGIASLIQSGRSGTVIPRLLAIIVSGLFIYSCDYARMINDEAINEYEMAEPTHPTGTVPIHSPYLALKTSPPESLNNPLPYNPGAIAEGRKRYGYYCVQCHGDEAKGFGTVGQSFAPLPTNLRSDRVQSLSDGVLFKRINLGFRRHPPLAYTLQREEAWNIIHYIHSLREQGRQ